MQRAGVQPTRARGLHRRAPAALLVLLLLVLAAPAEAGASTAGTSVISGSVFQDANRNGVMDPGEAPLTGKGVYLLDATGQTQLGYTASDAAGDYRFTGLADGSYRVQFDPSDWWAIRRDWVPTTTGSILPRISVSLAGSATADFGWRRIVRSSDVSAPISDFTGPTGLRVRSYDDAVSARDVYYALMRGSLIGPEAASVGVVFDWGDTSATSMGVSGSPGSYADYHATAGIDYISWLESGDKTLFHEYGHAWSMYYAYGFQQSTALTSYLQARGIAGDPRLDTSHEWSRYELIAEDYRQLFGTANAASTPQENRDLPPAAAVPGLRDFLAGAYTQPPAPAPTSSPTPTPTPSPTPTPAPALAVSRVAMSPDPVKTGGTASFSLSVPGSVTASIRDAKGNVVRTLLQAVAEPGGQLVSAAWDRKSSGGQRVKSGTYTLAVDAVDSSGRHATAGATFAVS